MKNNYFFLFFLLLSALLNAQTVQLEEHWWTPNANVYSIVKDGNTVYLSGNFTSFGPNVPYGASISTTTGLPDMTMVKPNGLVMATVPDGSGGWYIGGQFTTVGGQTRNRIARINSDGSLHPWNPNADNPVHTLAVNGTTVYAGGDFTNIGGQARSYIAAIDATTGLATTWNPNASSYVYALAINGATVYAGGNFTAIGGQTRNRIAEIDATTGAATTWNPNADSYVNALTLNGTTLYVGGAFTSIGGQSRNRIAALDIPTGLATSWNPDANNYINDLTLDGATLYIGGAFTGIGGQTRNYIAAVDTTTGLPKTWQPNADNIVRALVVNGSTVYVGGDFTNIGGQTRNKVASLDATTGLATAWDPNASSTVSALAINGTNIYVGGNFTTMGAGLVRNRIAALDATTGQLTAWNPNANNTIQSIAVNGNTVYAGGNFTSIGGQTRNRIAALDATTGLATAWNPNANNNVKTVTVNGTTVYVGGDFTTIGGQARNYIAALDTATGLATSWNPNANNTVNTIITSGSTIYAGGYFGSIGGQTRNYIAELDAATGLATSWNPNANNIVNTIAISGSAVYVGGISFSTIGGQSRNSIAAIDAATGLATSWNPNANGPVRSIAVNGSTVYAGGDFTNIAGQPRNRIASIDAATGVATTWNPDANGSIWTIFEDSGKIYTGGPFSSINGKLRNRFAVFNLCTLTATAGSQTNVLCHGAATGEATVTAAAGTGAYTYSWNTTPVQTTATATNLAAGTYTATVTDANGCTATQSFTITEPATALTASAGAQTNVLCFGNATGQATVNATGGTGAYTYSWDTTPVQTTATATNLAAGTYIATVTDANNCTATQSFTITEPTVLTASAGAQTNVLCNSNATGEATVTATGGTGAYTYSWNTTPAQTTATATNLTAGTYIATVTDANNCTATQSFTITEPTVLTASAGTQVDALCNGNATGEATVNAMGGTGVYTYSWNTTPVQTTATATNLAAGTYIATVTDANNCTATQSFTITEPATAMTLTPNTTQTDVLCNGQATGSATVAVTGGTGAYTYLWSNGGTANTITGLIAGTYTVDVTDANGCTINNSFTITQPAALVATAGSQTNVLCHGNATGEATVNATGGTGAYTYSWNTTPAQTTATASGLAAGTYTVTVYDANQCQTSQSFTITQPAQPLSMTPNTSQTNVSCFGGANGTASMAITGGTSPYTYLWSNGQTNAIATGLVAGTYTVTATDANGCTIANSYTITEPTALIATAGPQMNITCFGAANGAATVNATGGTGAYSYSWNTTPVQTTATATNLAPGNYTATVTDANNCAATQSFTITQPQQLTAAINNSANILCYGAATGSASVSAAGGTNSYTYLWNNGQTTATATALTAGNYSVIVTDANGCQANANVTITQPATPLVATAGAQTNLICNGNTNGSATVNVTGGTGVYSYNWSPSGGTAATATGLAAGSYTVTVYDANQCQTTQSFTITQPSQPLSMTPNTSQTNVSCFGGTNGTASMAVTGGTSPYTYLWSNGQTNAIATGLVAGTYTVTATDANGCTIANSYTITEPTALIATAGSQMNITCFGAANGSATVNATGGTGAYSYSWNTTPVQTTATATNLAPGNYVATVTDANNCTATQSFTITQPQQLTASINNSANILCYGAATGSASVSATGGTSSYTYLWNNGQTTATATALTAGNYSVIVTDANGCQANANVTITQPATPLVATSGAQTNLICNGNTNGSATVNVTGGTGTYTYSWNTTPVQTTATATGLAAGTYTVTVYDANQCQTTHSFTITQPAAVAGYFTIINSDCHATGSAVLHPTGGVAPYTYLWSNGNTTPNLLNALPGTYTVTVTDVNGCSNVLSTTINGTVPIVVTSQPQSVTIDGGETAIFTVEAQNVVYYQWQVSTNGGQTFSNLNGGGSMPGYNGVATPTLTITNAYQVLDGYQYRVILMQQNGCYILSDAATLTVNAPIVGIDETTKPEVSIYPNPASTEVFVKVPDLGAYKNIALSIYDLNGRLVKNENNVTSDEYKIDVTGLESGVYIITITTDKGKMDKKLIVNKKP